MGLQSSIMSMLYFFHVSMQVYRSLFQTRTAKQQVIASIYDYRYYVKSWVSRICLFFRQKVSKCFGGDPITAISNENLTINNQISNTFQKVHIC